MSTETPLATDSAERLWRQRLGQLRHDLVNPLGELLGFADMVIEDQPEANGGSLTASLQQIRGDARRLLVEINRALHPETRRSQPATTQAVGESIRPQLVALAEIAARQVERSAGELAPTLRDDLERIASAAQRLCDLQPLIFAQAAALAPPWSRDQEGDGSEATIAPPTLARRPRDEAGQHATILVVDDMEANRALLARRLRRSGYAVETAESGSLAIERLQAGHADLVLLDIMMPEVDGVEVLRRIKGDPKLAHIPVVMLSALDELDAVVRCIELGAEDYLPKPFPSALLHARVEACLAGKRMSDKLRRYAGWLFGRALVFDALAAPSSLVLKRQERTVLFADIRGFTAWTEQRTPEEAVAMLNGYFELAETVWADSSVIKTEYTGDEVMAVFPGPIDALQIAEALRTQLAPFLSPYGLAIGIGVNTGPVIEGLVGGSAVKAYRFVGDTVNTAKRICSEAGAGQLLVSDATFRQAYPARLCMHSLELSMKGKAAPVRVWPLEISAANS